MDENPVAPVARAKGEHCDSPTHLHRYVHARQLKWTAVVVVSIIVIMAFAGVVLQHSQSSPSATITVTGSGTVQGSPDTVSFVVGVHTVAYNATGAFAQNNARVGALEATLLRHGVTKKEIQTTGLNIYENTGDGGRVTGFSVDDNLNVTLDPIGRAGSAIDAAVGAVGNGIQLYGVTLSISNDSRLLASARAKAVHNAYDAAVQIANGANTTVGHVVRISDQENLNPPSIMYGYNAAATRAPSPSIEGGSQPISVQVTVIYSLKS